VSSILTGRRASENRVFIGEIGFCIALFWLTHAYRFFPKIRHFDLKSVNKWQQ
jgi:hypothetical protein